MGKASRTKQVTRASGAKKAAMRGKRQPWGFYSIVFLIVAAGIGGVALTVGGRAHAGSGTPPTLNDHWHEAYAVDICGTVQPNLPQPTTLIGLHTHGDGLIHVEPGVTGSALDRGANATLARFADGEPRFKLTSTELQYPGHTTVKNGGMCDGKPAALKIRVWPSATGDTYSDYTDPKAVNIKDGAALTVAFVPTGTDIPKPTTIANLSNPNAGEATPPPTS